MSLKLFFGAIVVIAGIYFRESYSVKLSPTFLNDAQVQAIQEFRSAVEKDLPHEYMREDYYLLRFLSAMDFNVREATDLLKDNLKWREAEKIDSILKEDWSDYEARFPYEFTEDKDGRPVLYYNYGAFDIAKEAKSKDFDRFKRYFTAKMLEDADRKVRESNSHRQFDIVINMDGFSRETHGCLACIALYGDLFRDSEAQYTGAADNVFIVNAPSVFELIYPTIASTFLMSRSHDSVKVLGWRRSYERVLLKHINKDKFPSTLK